MKITANNINDMDIMNMKSQASMLNIVQKIGKGKRKVSVLLDKSSQKFLESFMKELLKTMETNPQMSKLKNVTDFFNYVIKSVTFDKKQKRPKVLSLLLSYEEQDFMCMHLLEAVKGIKANKGNLKWYNLFKKMAFASYTTQCQHLYDIFKKATK